MLPHTGLRASTYASIKGDNVALEPTNTQLLQPKSGNPPLGSFLTSTDGGVECNDICHGFGFLHQKYSCLPNGCLFTSTSDKMNGWNSDASNFSIFFPHSLHILLRMSSFCMPSLLFLCRLGNKPSAKALIAALYMMAFNWSFFPACRNRWIAHSHWLAFSHAVIVDAKATTSLAKPTPHEPKWGSSQSRMASADSQAIDCAQVVNTELSNIMLPWKQGGSKIWVLRLCMVWSLVICICKIGFGGV